MRIPPVDVTQIVKPLVSVKETTAPTTPGMIPGGIEGITPGGIEQIGEVGGDLSASFTQAMKKAVGEVNSLQTQADKLAVNLASGDIEDVHKAMMAMQKARLALDFTIQVRNKVIEAYQEIMRMQV